jgi:hypothetical protein
MPDIPPCVNHFARDQLARKTCLTYSKCTAVPRAASSALADKHLCLDPISDRKGSLGSHAVHDQPKDEGALPGYMLFTFTGISLAQSYLPSSTHTVTRVTKSQSVILAHMPARRSRGRQPNAGYRVPSAALQLKPRVWIRSSIHFGLLQVQAYLVSDQHIR